MFDFTPNPTQKNWLIIDPAQYPGLITMKLDGVEGGLENPLSLPKAFGGTSEKPIVVGS